jgi:Lrp/AsnC family transcriptional regulator
MARRTVDKRKPVAFNPRSRGVAFREAWHFRRFAQTDFAGLSLDKIDRKILTLLQRDATMPVAEIGRKVGLSTTPCWRRIQKMEEDGVIKRRVAVLDPVKVNAGVTVFVAVKTNEHNEAWLRKFAGAVEDFPEVVEFYRMSGDVDYLMRVVVPDIGAYDSFYKKLIGKIALTDVSSSFAMEQIKYTTALPLDFAVVSDEER